MRIQLYGADPSGNSWDEGSPYEDALDAIQAVEDARAKHPGWAYGLYDLDDPEKGDVEAEAEETLWEELDSVAALATCPGCDGPATLLGALGFLTHLRCRDCGLDWSIETEEEE